MPSAIGPALPAQDLQIGRFDLADVFLVILQGHPLGAASARWCAARGDLNGWQRRQPAGLCGSRCGSVQPPAGGWLQRAADDVARGRDGAGEAVRAPHLAGCDQAGAGRTPVGVSRAAPPLPTVNGLILALDLPTLPQRADRVRGELFLDSDMTTPGPRPSKAAGAAGGRPKAAAVVAAELRRQIVTGRLKPGDKLHPENVLQAEFSISRPTMREALRMLEAESLISIRRGNNGGARVMAIDLSTVASQVGVFLQVQGTTLQDVWQARTVIEPPAAGMLAARRDTVAFGALEANIAAAREAAKGDLIRYADLSAEFSMLITRHCGNRTLDLLAALLYDIIRRQHEHVTERTLQKTGVAALRQENIRRREHALQLMRTGTPQAVEVYWREHLEHMRDLVLAVYKDPMTIDVLSEPASKPRAVRKVRRTVADADAA